MSEALLRVPLERRCLKIVSIADLESLQEAVLAELAELCGAQSGAIWIAGERGVLRLRGWTGLADRGALPEKVDPSLVQATAWKAEDTLLVPIATSGEVVGVAQLTQPIAGGFSDDVLGPAAVLGEFAAPTIKAAMRLVALQRQGLRDPQTGAYTLSYFTDYATKEIYKARRYGRSFSLLTFSLDNLSQLKARLGAPSARTAQKCVQRALGQITRDSDVVARATEQELHVLLPETDYFGALMFLRRSLASVHEDPEARALELKQPFGLTGGAATFPRDGDDFDELLALCRRRMEERRGSLQRLLTLDTLSFWDEVELLLGNSRSPRLPETKGEPSRRGRVADVLFDELQVELSRELMRDPHARGLLYVGAPEVNAELPLVMGLQGAPSDFGPRVYLLGRHGDLESHPAITPVFLEGDERLARHEFLLWMGDGSAYALLQRRGRGATWGFHSSDPTLVEGLVSRLQSAYDLQPY